MAIVPKFTPELLVSTPRRGPAVPNSDGTLAFFRQTIHEIGGTTTKEYHVLSIETGKTERLISDANARDVVWLGHDGSTILYLSQGEGGYTWLKTVDASNPSAEPCVVDFVEAPVNNLKVKALKNGTIAFVVVGLADNDGHLYNEEVEAHKVKHTARVTENYNPRGWDSYEKPERYTLWYTSLTEEDGELKLNKPLRNVVRDTTLTAPPGTSDPGDPTSQFDISEGGIVFAAAQRNVGNPRRLGLSNIYHLPLASFGAANTQDPALISLQSDGDTNTWKDQGYCSQPRFSPNGEMIVFLRSSVGRILDNSIWVKHADSRHAIDVFANVTGKRWNLIPYDFEFAPDGHGIYLQAPDAGRSALYKLDLLPNAYPRVVLREGSVSGFYHLPHSTDNAERLLVTSTSFTEPWIYQVVDVGTSSSSPEPWVISRTSQHVNLGLSPKQVSEIYFEGAGDYVVQAWVVKPRDFDPEKKYPLCLHVHGGPNSSWADTWNTRWNSAVWAEQGYVVVAPNITGSDGLGLEMAEAIHDNWGGRPYEDLVNCLEYVKDMPGIDMKNAVAAGNSYGGYMMNWIQGHELGRRFKALVCHAGIFNLPTFMLQTDALPGLAEHYGGPPTIWNNFDGLERYNPARSDLLKNWKTPMLVIHGDKDYRVPITEALGAFHTLKALGVPARFLSFDDENHWVAKEENSLEWHRQVFAWINKWSGVATKNAST